MSTTLDKAAGRNHSDFIWRTANLLRGTYKPSPCGSVILPFVALRRFNCALEPTKEAVRAKASRLGEARTSTNRFPPNQRVAT